MKYKLFYSLIALFSAIGLRAQTVMTNDLLKSLINTSFTYFPKMNEVQNSIQVAQQNVDLAGSNTLEVNGSASYAYVRPKIVIGLPLGDDGAVTNIQSAPVHNGNANINASYVLFDFGRLKANVDKAKSDLKLANANVGYVKNQLAFQISTIFYNIVYYKKAIEIEDSVIAYLDENKRIIDSKLRNGDAIKIDLLNVQASRDNESNTRENLKNELQKQYNLLHYTTGLDVANGHDFDFDFLLPNGDAALAEAEANNPDFEIAKDKILQSESAIAQSKLLMKPSVVLNAATGYKNGYVPNVNELRYNYQAGIGLNVPIYAGGKMKKQIALAQSQKQQNELQVATLRNDYQRDISQAYTDIHSNEERIKNTYGQIEQAKAAERLAATRYFNGVGTNLEITNASTNVQRAEFTKLQYEYQLCLAKVQLSKILGYQYW